jgi:uncharacterized protein (TIGR00369 family)
MNKRIFPSPKGEFAGQSWRLRRMSHERIDELLTLFNKKAPIARHFGMKLSYTDDGSAVIDLPYNPQLDHALGGIHGGVYATLLDSAGWFAAAATHDISCWLATSEITVRFFEPVAGLALRAVGRVLKHGKRQDIAEVRLYDEKNRLVGHATGTFIVLTNVPLN